MAFRGLRPRKDMTVDHSDPVSRNNYELNLRWATIEEQAANKSNNSLNLEVEESHTVSKFVLNISA